MSTDSSERRSECIDGIQSGQYEFPYHYIPSNYGFPKFSRSWRFAPSYLAAVRLAADWLAKLERRGKQHNHMDYGCGDGGFVIALQKETELTDITFSGVDFDRRAIRWAQTFSGSDSVFRCIDVQDLEPEVYDSGSLIEVFEHIPPADADGFVAGIAKSLKKGALLFVTVPSTEKSVESKHYRHFDFGLLEGCFGQHFGVIEKFGFEKQTLVTKWLPKLMMNRYIVAETPITSQYLVNRYQRKHNKLDGCGRIGMVLRKL